MLDYTKLTAPREHGGLLLEPGPQESTDIVRRNHLRFQHEKTTVAGKALYEWRSLLRHRHLNGVDAPIIVVGHQPDFIHAGVWAKNVVASRIAQAVHGTAVHLVVDCDSPKRLSIRIPVHGADHFSVSEIPMGVRRQGFAYEQLERLGEEELRQAILRGRSLPGFDYGNCVLPIYFEGFDTPVESDWVAQAVAGRKRVEVEFGVEMSDLRLSEAWWSPLAIELLVRASDFLTSYNEALAKYRQEHGVRGANRPIPDLTGIEGRIELPFWMFREGRPRSRVFLEQQSHELGLWAETEKILTLARRDVEASDDVIGLVRDRCGWHLRPRALITTIWARLFLADLFIHGIGGAKYDRISDRIIEQFFGMDAPEFACVTATLFMYPELAARADDTPAICRMRELEWNPERALTDVRSEEWDLTIAQLQEAIKRSEELRRNHPFEHDQRRDNHVRIRELREQIHRRHPQLRAEIGREAQRLSGVAANRRVALDREYFFALHSRSSLHSFVNRMPAARDFV